MPLPLDRSRSVPPRGTPKKEPGTEPGFEVILHGGRHRGRGSGAGVADQKSRWTRRRTCETESCVAVRGTKVPLLMPATFA
jgi:hypothetical protein